jgi:predicted protein tyrosine phosphatase
MNCLKLGGTIVICGLDEVSHHRTYVTHVISITDPDAEDILPSLGLDKTNRLVLKFHDLDCTEEAERGFDGRRQVAPQEIHVRKGLSFASRLDSVDKLLVHCHQGISRSTALAFAILCQANPKSSEEDILAEVVRLRPYALPNKLLVQHADKILARKGRMIRALARLYGKIS